TALSAPQPFDSPNHTGQRAVDHPHPRPPLERRADNEWPSDRDRVPNLAQLRQQEIGMSDWNQPRHMANLQDFKTLRMTQAGEEVARKERGDGAPACMIWSRPLLDDRQVVT